MTSELKPCPFYGGKSEIEQIGTARMSTTYQCEDCGCRLETSETFNHGNHWNTRSVPDVPELVRYRLNSLGELVYSENGSYVLHSQAAEIIAADRAEKHRAQEAVLKLERELAQYKDQIPIGYITPKAQLSLLQEFSASDSISPVKIGECRVAIYDRPAPAADLKAENERLRAGFRKLMSGYVNTLENGMDIIRSLGGSCDDLDTMINNDPYLRDARAALKVEASNDKG